MSGQGNGENELFVEHGMVVQRLVLSRGRDGESDTTTTRTICAEGAEMALCYDRRDGTAHKLGPRAAVEAWADALREGMRQANLARPGIVSPEDIKVVSFLATPDSLQAATDCWARTGSSGDFAAAFGQAEAPAPGGPRH